MMIRLAKVSESDAFRSVKESVRGIFPGYIACIHLKSIRPLSSVADN